MATVRTQAETLGASGGYVRVGGRQLTPRNARELAEGLNAAAKLAQVQRDELTREWRRRWDATQRAA